MKFYRKRRRTPTVAIVSLIDILAILLIFFIVTTTFKTKESLVQVNLPRSTEMGEGEDVEKRIPLALAKDGRISLGERVLAIEGLAAALGEFKAQNPKGRLELKADEGAPLGSMVKVWDAAAAAGIDLGDLPLRILLEN